MKRFAVFLLSFLATVGIASTVSNQRTGNPIGVSGTVTANHVAVFNDSNGNALKDGGAPSGGTVTSVSSPSGTITVGTPTTTPTLDVVYGTSANTAMQGNAGTQAAIVPNTAPSAGATLIGNAGGTAYASTAISGDAALASTGALTVSKIGGVTPGGTCTNQFARSISSSAVPTCASIANADLASGLTYATPTLTGVATENGTFSEVTATLASAPSAPSSGSITRYALKLAGRETVWVVGPLGLPRALEFPDANSFKSGWATGAATAGNVYGFPATQTGTAAIVIPTATNRYTMMARTTFASVVTTTNQNVGIQETNNAYFRGNAAGIGGFAMIVRFGFTSIKTGCRAFVGMSAASSGIVTSDPSSNTNVAGFGFDAADTAWTFMHNDASGTATKDAIGGQATLATNNTAFIAYIFAYPNDSVVYYRLDDLIQGTTLVDSSANTDLPVNTTALRYSVEMSNGTANTTAGDATIGIESISVFTEN